MKLKGLWHLMGLMAVAFMLSGCMAAARLADYKDGMKSDVKISQSIFLTATDAPKTIYVQTKNTSSNQNITTEFEKGILDRLVANGYKRVDKPSQASYILQSNIRYIGEWKENMNLGDTALGAGIGALSGIGLTRPSNFNSMGTNAVGLAAAGAVIGFVAEMATKVKTEVVTIDIQVIERPGKGQEIKHTAGIAARVDDLERNFKKEEATRMLLITAAGQIAGIF